MKLLEKSKIRFVLRAGIVGAFLSLVFLFSISWHYFEVFPDDLARYFVATLGASSGTRVEVPSNPYNTLAQQLIEKEEELDRREEVLEGAILEMERENRTMLNLVLGSITALFILLLANFYLDYRARAIESRKIP